MYTKRLVNKKIEHFSTNEIFEIIEYSKDFEKIKIAKSELKNRNFNEDEIKSAKSNYEKYKILRKNRKTENLTITEWLSFFFVLFKIGDYFSPSESFTDSELERFIVYGYETKFEQAVDARKSGILFFFIIIPLGAFVISQLIR